MVCAEPRAAALLLRVRRARPAAKCPGACSYLDADVSAHAREAPAADELRASRHANRSPQALALPHGSSRDHGAAAGARERSRCRSASEAKPCARRHHRPTATVDSRDDLLGVDPLQVDRGRAEVRVPELALDDVERHALTGELDRSGGLSRRRASRETVMGTSSHRRWTVAGAPSWDGRGGATTERCRLPSARPLLLSNSGGRARLSRCSAVVQCSHLPAPQPRERFALR